MLNVFGIFYPSDGPFITVVGTPKDETQKTTNLFFKKLVSEDEDDERPDGVGVRKTKTKPWGQKLAPKITSGAGYPQRFKRRISFSQKVRYEKTTSRGSKKLVTKNDEASQKVKSFVFRCARDSTTLSMFIIRQDLLERIK